jgi:hypothetical protein
MQLTPEIHVKYRGGLGEADPAAALEADIHSVCTGRAKFQNGATFAVSGPENYKTSRTYCYRVVKYAI